MFQTGRTLRGREQMRQRCIEDQRLDAAMLDDIFELGRLQANADRHRNGTSAHCSKRRQHELDARFAQNADARAGRNPARSQVAGNQ